MFNINSDFKYKTECDLGKYLVPKDEDWQALYREHYQQIFSLNCPSKSLVVAAELGCESAIELLLCQGAHPDYQEKDNYAPPLFLAALHAHVAAVKMLLNYGANVKVSFYHCLSAALQSKNEEVIQLVSAHTEELKISLLEQVIEKERWDLLELWKQKGLNLNCTDEDYGSHILHRIKNPLAIKKLLALGVRPQADFSGNTPLHYAAEERDAERIATLIWDGNSSLFVKNNQDETPLQWIFVTPLEMRQSNEDQKLLLLKMAAAAIPLLLRGSRLRGLITNRK